MTHPIANKGSFAQRVAAMAPSIENWDDDVDFQGDLFANSVSTIQTSFSSRISINSESNAGDDDWQVLIKPNDELSKDTAISSAKLAGIPIPSNVPSSALLGGSIKRLGKKKSRTKVVTEDDDWGDDLELPALGSGALKLKTPPPQQQLPLEDESEDWGEGSLGIRFAGTRRDGRNRSSSASAMSPSMNSCITLESEDDDFMGLVLPTGAIDFKARLSGLKDLNQSTPNVSPNVQHTKVLRELPPRSVPQPVALPQSAVAPPQPKPIPKPTTLLPTPLSLKSPAVQHKPSPTATAHSRRVSANEEDFFADIDLGGGDLVNSKKATLNRNVKIQSIAPKQPPALRTVTSLTFTDKPAASRIPRPLQLSSKPSRLDPVYEPGAYHSTRNSRPGPTTTNSQLLRAKRSAPLLRNSYAAGANTKPAVPFRPAGISSQAQTLNAKPSQTHLRRDSDPNRAKSPVFRSFSRMSTQQPPDTPSRPSARRDIAPAALAREAASKRTFTKPAKRRNYGDGSELEVFDDLPTSAAKESKFVKAPVGRGAPKALRTQTSNSRFPAPDRMTTPLPATPSTVQSENTPRFARDTTASRIAREQRLNARSRADGQIMPNQKDWKAHVAARSPHNSPTTQRTRRGTGQRPVLIKPMSSPMAKNEKGMIYNPILHRWEGNEGALAPFQNQNHSMTNLTVTTNSTPFTNRIHHQHSFSQPQTSSARQFAQGPPSPPRPALISNISTARGVQVERGMVFDPRKMCWLKLDPASRTGTDPLSPSVDDEDDPFAGLEDLKDDSSRISIGAGAAGGFGNANGFGGNGGSQAGGSVVDAPFVGEEFDLGPEFIRRQREEETNWRRRTEGWVGSHRDAAGDGWRWAVRDLVAVATEGMRR